MFAVSTFSSEFILLQISWMLVLIFLRDGKRGIKTAVLRFCPEFGFLWATVNCPIIFCFVNRFAFSHLVLFFSHFMILKVCSANRSHLSSVLLSCGCWISGPVLLGVMPVSSAQVALLLRFP